MPNKDGRIRVERAALELFAECGVGDISTRQIAKRAGMATGTLYRHYASKDELAVALFLDAANRLLASMETGLREGRTPEDKVRALVGCFFDFAANEPHRWQYLMHAHPPLRAVPKGTRLPKDVVVDVVREGIRAGTFTVRDPALGAALVIGMTVRSVFFLQQGLLAGPSKNISEEVAGAALRALGARSFGRTRKFERRKSK